MTPETAHFLTYALWFAAPVIQAVTAIALLRKRLWRDMPVFLAYTVSHVLRAAILYSILHLTQPSKVPYFYSVWTAELFDSILSFAVIREIYANVFRPYHSLNRLASLLFMWAAVVLAAVGTVTAAASTGTEPVRVVRAVTAFYEANSIVIGGLLLLLFAMASVLELRWQESVFGIAIGFAMYSTIDLTGMAWRLHMGPAASQQFSLIRSFAYNCATLIWVVYCLRREERIVPGAVSHSDLQRWNQELGQFLRIR